MPATARAYPRLGQAIGALSLLAWLGLLGWPGLRPAAPRAGGGSLATWCGAAHSLPPDVLAALSRAAPPASLLHTWAAALTWAWAGAWVLMLAAMMLPTLGQAIYYLLVSSLARRRARQVGLFVAGYGALWLAAGAALLLLALGARRWGPPGYWLPAGAALLALGWQASPAKQRCLNRGHRHPSLAAFGWRADYDALRLGLTHGGWCVASCWAAMLLPLLLAQGHLWLMAAVSLLIFCERLDPPARPAWRWRGFATALAYVRLHLRGRWPRPASPSLTYAGLPHA